MRVLSGAGLFTAPREPHRFTGITSDLGALVLFAPAEYRSGRPSADNRPARRSR
jgi:hypothetical protein